MNYYGRPHKAYPNELLAYNQKKLWFCYGYCNFFIFVIWLLPPRFIVRITKEW